MERRSFLRGLLGSSALVCSRALLAQPGALSLRVSDEARVPVPADFVGLSYETAQLAHPEFFSAKNTTLIQFFRTLSPRGVLRLGGNMSEFTRWDPQGALAEPAGETEAPDPGYGSKRVYPVTPRAIENLAGFLRATGWRLIYGLNLARGEAGAAADEAACVARAVGDRLVALQFGNEPDLFKQDDDRTRKWSYDEFLAKWQSFYHAVRQALPAVPIAGPDTSNPRWNRQFLEDVGHKVVLQTGHFYPEGPPADPRMTIAYLLHSGDRLRSFATPAVELARQSGIAFRMAEGNSCYAAGKPGVSDTFASALWVADMMLTLAGMGAAGVNLHGGGDGLYTPIAGAPSKGYVARPIYYGMLLAASFAGATMLAAELATAGRNVRAFAARDSGKLRLAVINMEPDALLLDLNLPLHKPQPGRVWRLQAPSLESTENVMLAATRLTAQGHFVAQAKEQLRLNHGRGQLQLPGASAALVVVG